MQILHLFCLHFWEQKGLTLILFPFIRFISQLTSDLEHFVLSILFCFMKEVEVRNNCQWFSKYPDSWNQHCLCVSDPTPCWALEIFLCLVSWSSTIQTPTSALAFIMYVDGLGFILSFMCWGWLNINYNILVKRFNHVLSGDSRIFCNSGIFVGRKLLSVFRTIKN